MTSKQALECISFQYKQTSPIFSVWYKEYLEPIEKDLEVLEVLKDLIFNDICEIFYTQDKKYITLEFFGTDYKIPARIDEKEYKQIEIIKEWLEK